LDAKREATEAERDARKARRAEMASAVAEARRVAAQTREARQTALLEAEKTALSQRTKNVQSVADKAGWQVKHAIAVVAAQKEKERADAAAAGEKLTHRLDLAGEFRLAHRERYGSPSSSVLHRVRNDEKVMSQQRKKLNELKEAKATTKRELFIQSVVDKAGAVADKAAAVVAAQQAKAQGTDAVSVANKAALYDRLLRAEVSRLTTLRQRQSNSKHGDTVSVIVVKIDKTPKMPPPALSLRLGTISNKLVATSNARQKGAASRRAILRAKALLKAEKANEKRAAALARVGKTLARKEAHIKAKANRSIVTLGLAQGRALFSIAQANQRMEAAEQRRTAACDMLRKQAEAYATARKQATERHAAKLRALAKKGVADVRAASNKSRRDARDAKVMAHGEANSARCAKAAERRAAFLAARVTLAQKHLKALHPKREVADMEIKEA